jgi:two-component system phosphate regulon sensor histidine kinase PhoR
MLAETLRLRELGRPERHEYLDLILSESNRLGRLLKNVLNFAQVEKGTRVYQPEPVKLGAVLEAVPHVLQQPLQEKRLVLEVTGDDDLELNADPDALEQAVLNLLYNAIKYSPPGGRIALRTRRDARDALIEVADQGVGIHPREHRRIFDRFYRVPEAHNRRVPGTGLGLALVKHIVEGHGGRVMVESAPGKGSTFTIRLPLPDAARPT